MANPNARRFAIARSIARRKKAAAVAAPAPIPAAKKPAAKMEIPVIAAQNAARAPEAIHIDLQSASMREGRTKGGQPYVSFFEGGMPLIMGFGLICETLKRDRIAKGMAVRERGMLKVVALDSAGTLLDERGDYWRQAA